MEYVLTPYATKIEPFVWWQDAFTEGELNWLQSKAKTSSSAAEVGGGTGGVVNHSIRRSSISWLSNNSETEWVFKKLAHVVASINAQFYKFDLSGFGESLQMTNYDQSDNGMYGWHQDYGGEISRKLSVVVQLTDPSEYEGGNLQIMTSSEPTNVRKQRGLVALFPSYTLHQVTPVTSGSRQSLVAWVTGVPFR